MEKTGLGTQPEIREIVNMRQLVFMGRRCHYQDDLTLQTVAVLHDPFIEVLQMQGFGQVYKM